MWFLGFLLWLLGIYWAAYFIFTGLDKPYFYGFIYGIASSLIFLLCFLGWWWGNRTLRLWEKHRSDGSSPGSRRRATFRSRWKAIRIPPRPIGAIPT